jgi:hypothetical protein
LTSGASEELQKTHFISLRPQVIVERGQALANGVKYRALQHAVIRRRRGSGRGSKFLLIAGVEREPERWARASASGRPPTIISTDQNQIWAYPG